MNEKETLELSDWIALDQRHVWHPFTQAQTAPDPVLIERGAGVYLYSRDGRRLVDYISSWWVNLFGHGHPKIANAIAEQADRLEHAIFAGFTHTPAIELATTLARMLPGELNRVFFSDNGSTSVEVALKMAYQYVANQGEHKRKRFITFDGAYHGDTVGAMSAGVSSRMFDAWQELLFTVDVMPYPHTWEQDADCDEKEESAFAALKQHVARHGDEICAMIIEPLVQGAGGMRMVRPGFVRRVVEWLHSRGIIVIFDEVMTGFGRTGARFACEKIGVIPDLICLSKGLTGGFLPLSVTVAKDFFYDAFLGDRFERAFCHGHSYTANPLGCAAALAAMELLQNPEIERRIKQIEAAHNRGLDTIRDLPQAMAPRICGTIAAFDARVSDAGYDASLGNELKRWFWDRNMLIRPLGNVIYQMPPYVISDEQVEAGWKASAEAVRALVK